MNLRSKLPLLSFLAVSVVLVFLFLANARHLSLEDGTTARRALLLLKSTDTRWTITLAYSILSFIAQPFLHSIFALRTFGFALLGLATLIFSTTFLKESKADNSRWFMFAALFWAGLGVYCYFPNSLPEYDHLAVFCVLGICSVVLAAFDRSSLAITKRLLLGFLFGLFLATNVPAATLTLLLFCVYWWGRQTSPRSSRDIRSVFSFSLAFFCVFFFLFRETGEGAVNPSVIYNKEALKELETWLFPSGALLYVIFRAFTFLIELLIVVGVITTTYFLGKLSSKSTLLTFLFKALPFAWLFGSIVFTLKGFETYQIPSLWDFSPNFFLGKIVWYGFATTFPLLIFISIFIGGQKLIGLNRKEYWLMGFYGLVALSGCFASGARLVHKMLLYQWLWIFIAFYLTKKLNSRIRTQLALGILLIVSLQTIFYQYVPIHRMGGYKELNYSLDGLPRGEGLRVNKAFYDWIMPLEREIQKEGLKRNEAVLSNDYIACYLLGIHQGVLPSTRTFRWVLLHKEEVIVPLESRINHSRILKLLGPPNLPAIKLEKEDSLEKYVEENRYSLRLTLDRGTNSKTLLFSAN